MTSRSYPLERQGDPRRGNIAHSLRRDENIPNPFLNPRVRQNSGHHDSVRSSSDDTSHGREADTDPANVNDRGTKGSTSTSVTGSGGIGAESRQSGRGSLKHRLESEYVVSPFSLKFLNPDLESKFQNWKIQEVAPDSLKFWSVCALFLTAALEVQKVVYYGVPGLRTGLGLVFLIASAVYPLFFFFQFSAVTIPYREPMFCLLLALQLVTWYLTGSVDLGDRTVNGLGGIPGWGSIFPVLLCVTSFGGLLYQSRWVYASPLLICVPILTYAIETALRTAYWTEAGHQDSGIEVVLLLGVCVVPVVISRQLELLLRQLFIVCAVVRQHNVAGAFILESLVAATRNATCPSVAGVLGPVTVGDRRCARFQDVALANIFFSPVVTDPSQVLVPTVVASRFRRRGLTKQTAYGHVVLVNAFLKSCYALAASYGVEVCAVIGDTCTIASFRSTNARIVERAKSVLWVAHSAIHISTSNGLALSAGAHCGEFYGGYLGWNPPAFSLFPALGTCQQPGECPTLEQHLAREGRILVSKPMLRYAVQTLKLEIDRDLPQVHGAYLLRIEERRPVEAFGEANFGNDLAAARGGGGVQDGLNGGGGSRGGGGWENQVPGAHNFQRPDGGLDDESDFTGTIGAGDIAVISSEDQPLFTQYASSNVQDESTTKRSKGSTNGEHSNESDENLQRGIAAAPVGGPKQRQPVSIPQRRSFVQPADDLPDSDRHSQGSEGEFMDDDDDFFDDRYDDGRGGYGESGPLSSGQRSQSRLETIESDGEPEHEAQTVSILLSDGAVVSRRQQLRFGRMTLKFWYQHLQQRYCDFLAKSPYIRISAQALGILQLLIVFVHAFALTPAPGRSMGLIERALCGICFLAAATNLAILQLASIKGFEWHLKSQLLYLACFLAAIFGPGGYQLSGPRRFLMANVIGLYGTTFLLNSLLSIHIDRGFLTVALTHVIFVFLLVGMSLIRHYELNQDLPMLDLIAIAIIQLALIAIFYSVQFSIHMAFSSVLDSRLECQKTRTLLHRARNETYKLLFPEFFDALLEDTLNSHKGKKMVAAVLASRMPHLNQFSAITSMDSSLRRGEADDKGASISSVGASKGALWAPVAMSIAAVREDDFSIGSGIAAEPADWALSECLRRAPIHTGAGSSSSATASMVSSLSHSDPTPHYGTAIMHDDNNLGTLIGVLQKGDPTSRKSSHAFSLPSPLLSSTTWLFKGTVAVSIKLTLSQSGSEGFAHMHRLLGIISQFLTATSLRKVRSVNGMILWVLPGGVNGQAGNCKGLMQTVMLMMRTLNERPGTFRIGVDVGDVVIAVFGTDTLWLDAFGPAIEKSRWLARVAPPASCHITPEVEEFDELKPELPFVREDRRLQCYVNGGQLTLTPDSVPQPATAAGGGGIDSSVPTTGKAPTSPTQTAQASNPPAASNSATNLNNSDSQLPRQPDYEEPTVLVRLLPQNPSPQESFGTRASTPTPVTNALVAGAETGSRGPAHSSSQTPDLLVERQPSSDRSRTASRSGGVSGEHMGVGEMPSVLSFKS